MPIRRARLFSWLADLVAVTAFVLIGRSSHDEGWAGFVQTLAPFVVGVQIGWLFVGRGMQWKFRPGVVIWASTVIVGLILRVAFGDDIPLAFVLVTAFVLAVFLLGWRLLAAAFVGRLRTPDKP